MKIQQKAQIIPTRIKGLKISQAEERVNLTGNEMIPFQEGEHNGKIKITSFKGMSVYVFDPVVTDGKVSAEEYGRLYNAIRDNLLIYTPNASRKGLLVSTEHSIVNGELQLEFPNYVKEEGSNNITTVEFESITVSKELDYNRTLYNTLALKTTGDGDYVLTDNGKYIYIGDLALTNIKIKDNTNTSVYNLVTEAINLTNTNTPCIKWTTTKSGDNIYIDLFLAKATVDQDGIMSKEDKYKLDVTIPNELESLREALNKEIQDRKDEITRVDGRVDKEISDRISEIERVDTKIDKEIVDRTNEITRVDERIDKEIQDRTDADTLLQQQIDKEIADREKADDTLQNNINKEEESRIREDNILHDRIDLEIHDRTNADISITAKLNKEIEERISEITRIENKFDGATDDLEEALQQEIADRKAGDTSITNNLNAFINTKGQPGGLASLDSNGLVPSSQLPSYVDDVLEYSTLSAFPTTGETGKIYVTLDTNLTYRWSGTGYVEISKSLALGETSSTAYAGNKGKENRDALTSLPANLVSTVASPTANASNVVFNYTGTSKSGINYSTPTAKTLTIPAASSSAAGVMAAADKVKLDTTIPNQITDINNTITEIQDDITGINSGKVSKITVSGSGNAVTTGSIVGDTLTLTKGATYNNYVHPIGDAPSKALGLYKFATDSLSHVRNPIEVTKADITALGIPAQDTTYTLPLASASTRGGVKIGYTASGKNYPVQLSNEQMYVNVPWTDTNTNTTYTFANGSSGNFTVTPSGGSTQTVSIGKPATAGTADNSLGLNGYTYSNFLRKIYHYGSNDVDDAVAGGVYRLSGENTNLPSGYQYGMLLSLYGGGDTVGQLLMSYADSGRMIARSGNPSTVGGTGNFGAWRTVAFTSDNVASATKLQTRRLIFGKYFDGTANVEGQATVYGTNTTATSHYSSGGLQIREQGMVGNTQTSDEYAPRIGFHWGNRFGKCLIAWSNGFKFMDNDLDAYENIYANKVFAPNGFWKESDIRLKTNVKPLEHTIEQICAIPTASFIMNDKEQIGTIAQDIEELGFTEIVEDIETPASEVKDKEGFEVYTKEGVEYVKVKKVEYEMLSVIAIEGVKLLKDEIDKLKAEIETLKNK